MIPKEETELSQLEIIRCQVGAVEEIVRNETWYEGERRGGFVSHDDPVVQVRVSEILLDIGGEMRSVVVRQLRA